MEWRVLADVPPEHVREMLSIARRCTFKRDEVVFHQGDPAESLHLVVKGRFASRILTPLGQTAMLAVHGPGESFGELALLPPGSHRSATVSALEAAETFSVRRGEFFGLAARYPGVKDVLMALLADQIRRANERILVAHFVEADARVRWALVQLSSIYRDGDGAAIPLTQEQLAEFAGTARATANRVLREEKARGTVDLGRGCIRVLDLTVLASHLRGVPRG